MKGFSTFNKIKWMIRRLVVCISWTLKSYIVHFYTVTRFDSITVVESTVVEDKLWKIRKTSIFIAQVQEQSLFSCVIFDFCSNKISLKVFDPYISPWSDTCWVWIWVTFMRFIHRHQFSILKTLKLN